MPSWKKVIVSGSDAVLTSVTASFLGNLTGTSSFAVTAATATTATNVAWSGVSAGERTNYTLGFEAPSTGYAGFYFSTPGGNSDAGYLLVRGGADTSVYTENGITLVADKGWLTLAQRTTAGKGVRIMTGTTSTERLTVLEGGNVGIGVTNPVVKLQVNGTITSTGTLTAYTSVPSINIGHDGSTAFIAGTSGGGGNTSLSFSVGNNNEKMRITSAGNVGIGTNNPAAKLHVSGGIYLGGGNTNIRYRSSTNWDYYLDNTNDDFRIYDSDTTYFLQAVYNGGSTNKYLSLLNTLTVRNNGNVGIGTTNPTLAKLQILGNVSASAYTGSLFGTASFATTASYVNLAACSEDIKVTNWDQPDPGQTFYYTQVLSLANNCQDLTTLDTFGLHYESTPNLHYLDTGLTVTGSIIATTGFTGNLTGTASFANNATSASYARTASYAANATNIYNTDGSLTDNRFVDFNGNNLTFSGTEGESVYFDLTNAGTFEITGNPIIRTTGSLQHSGSSYFVGGNVGIGKTNPGSPLDVQSSANVLIIATSTDAGAKIKLSDTDSDVFIQNQSSTLSLGFSSTQNGQILHVSSGGNVGIGSTNPAAKFLVSYQGGNGSAGDSNYSILAKATGQQTIGAIATNDGYSNLNLGSTVGGSLRMWHISKRISTDASDLGGGDGITMYYYSGTFVQRFGFTTAGNFVASGSITAKTLANTNQANIVMYNSSTGLLTYLATSSFSVVSSSYAVSSSFSTFAATANYANSAGSATNADNVFVQSTVADQNYSLVLAVPDHDEYEELSADSTNASYNPGTGTLTAVRLVETSALKYKDNIESLGSTLDQVLKLRGVSFTKKNTGEQQIGFIADEIEKEFPQIVTKDNQGEIHGLSYQRMTAVLLESVKDLNSKIEAQNLFIKDLLDRIEKLENK